MKIEVIPRDLSSSSPCYHRNWLQCPHEERMKSFSPVLSMRCTCSNRSICWWDEWTKSYESMNEHIWRTAQLLTLRYFKQGKVLKTRRVSEAYPVCTAHSCCSRTWPVCVTSIAAICFTVMPLANNSPISTHSKTLTLKLGDSTYSCIPLLQQNVKFFVVFSCNNCCIFMQSKWCILHSELVVTDFLMNGAN